MAARGDVLELRRRLGFGASGRSERFVVLQADELNRALDTVLAAPLDEAADLYAEYPGAVAVGGAEAGTRSAQVLLVPQLSSVDLGRFGPARTGKLRAETLRRVDRTLKLLLSLP